MEIPMGANSFPKELESKPPSTTKLGDDEIFKELVRP